MEENDRYGRFCTCRYAPLQYTMHWPELGLWLYYRDRHEWFRIGVATDSRSATWPDPSNPEVKYCKDGPSGFNDVEFANEQIDTALAALDLSIDGAEAPKYDD